MAASPKSTCKFRVHLVKMSTACFGELGGLTFKFIGRACLPIARTGFQVAARGSICLRCWDGLVMAQVDPENSASLYTYLGVYDHCQVDVMSRRWRDDGTRDSLGDRCLRRRRRLLCPSQQMHNSGPDRFLIRLRKGVFKT